MKKILTILCCTFIFFAQSKGQSDTISGDYLVLYSGKIIQSDVVTYKNAYFHAGDKKYKEDEVSLYRNAEGSFANTIHMATSKNRTKTYFFKSENLGKISTYSYTVTSDFENKYHAYNTMKTVVYSKGMQPVKKYKYKNLKKDLRDNPNCKKLLMQERVFKTAKVVCLSLSLVSIAYGIKNISSLTYGPWVVTTVLATLGAKMNKIGNKKIEKALVIYNQ